MKYLICVFCQSCVAVSGGVLALRLWGVELQGVASLPFAAFCTSVLVLFNAALLRRSLDG